MQRGKPFDEGDEGGHEPCPSEDDDVMLPLVFDYLLNVPEDLFRQQVVDCLHSDRFIKFNSELEKPRFVRTGDILLFLDKSLFEQLFREQVQLLLQFFMTHLGL